MINLSNVELAEFNDVNILNQIGAFCAPIFFKTISEINVDAALSCASELKRELSKMGFTHYGEIYVDTKMPDIYYDALIDTNEYNLGKTCGLNRLAIYYNKNESKDWITARSLKDCIEICRLYWSNIKIIKKFIEHDTR